MTEAELAASLMHACSLTEDDFYGRRPIKELDPEERERPPESEDLKLYEIALLKRYYSSSYTNGYFPLFEELGELLEKTEEITKVWYGHDCDDSSFSVFHRQRREELSASFKSHYK